MMLSDLKAAICGCCGFTGSAFSLNGRRLKTIRLLGEGGLSFVYLVEDDMGEQYALKKIRCPFGADSVASAMNEINALKAFAHSPSIIALVDSALLTEQDGTKTVYELMPYYSHGTFQDLIENSVVSESPLSEYRVCTLAVATCQALKALHLHRASGPELQSAYDRSSPSAGGMEAGVPLGDAAPWAHRDIKPANVLMTGTDEEVVLTDFGSAAPAVIAVRDAKHALVVQEQAAELCTLPFRAPELLSVRANSVLSEAVDIWAFGCTIYALMYGITPFENEERVSGANLNMAILGGSFRFPNTPEYSPALREIVKSCLATDADQRPRIAELQHQFEQLLLSM